MHLPSPEDVAKRLEQLEDEHASHTGYVQDFTTELEDRIARLEAALHSHDHPHAHPEVKITDVTS